MVGHAPNLLGVDDAFRVFMQALPMAVYTTDAAGFITFFNQAAVQLAGRSPEIGRDRWCVTWRLYWPDGRPMPHEDCPMAIALKENRIIRGAEAVAERPDGTRFTFTPFPTPILGTSGAVVAGVNMLFDLTGRKATDRAQKALIGDLGTRLATVLRLVEVILGETRAQARGLEARLLISAAIQNVATLSVAQALLGDAGGESRVNAWDLLSTTCVISRETLQKGVELSCEASAGDLASEIALPLALIARELIVNAVKHGCKDGCGKTVRVALRREPGGHVLTVEDDGPGFALPSESSRSFGLGLVLALARQINGAFEVRRGPGACCSVRVPDPRTLH